MIIRTLQRVEEELSNHYVPDCRNDAEQLLAHLLDISPLELYLKKDAIISARQLEKLEGWVGRRCKREPLQYIVGEVNFYGNRIKVTPDVLIPRPETEQLVEQVKRVTQVGGPPMTRNENGIWVPIFGASAGVTCGRTRFTSSLSGGRFRVLEIGTGSGCIAIALAKELPGIAIVATDRSGEALKVARANARMNGVDKRIKFIEADVFPGDRMGTGLKKRDLSPAFDLIISNPPYIASGEFEKLQPEVRDWEPRSAIDGGPDGLKFYREIIPRVSTYLAPSGWLALEIGEDQGEAVREMAATKMGTRNGVHVPIFQSVEIKKDLNGHDRFLFAIS